MWSGSTSSGMQLFSVRSGLKRVVDVKDNEIDALCTACGAFFCALAAYFILLPLRDEAGVSIGTSRLPSLFATSLFLTLFAAPITSAWISRPRLKQGIAVQQLARSLCASILVFCILYAIFFPVQSLQVEPRPGRMLLQSNQAAHEARLGDQGLTGAQRCVKIGFFLWVSLINLLMVSTLWTHTTDVFPSDSAKRLFGVIGAGATFGQLVGSSCATLWSFVAPRVSGMGVVGQTLGTPFVLPMLVAALLCELSGRCAAAAHLPRKAAVEQDSTSGEAGNGAARSPSIKSVLRNAVVHTANTAREGFIIIRTSPYLRLLCAYLTLNYITSSFFYFQKSVLVSTLGRSAVARTRFFAILNTWSAFIMGGMQLTASGPALKRLGMPWSLAITPLCSAVLMTVLTLTLSPGVLAITEVTRKVLIYSIARPAREVLFTVIHPQDKHKVKIFIDTLMQRCGDALAAALFQLLDVTFGGGPGVLCVCSLPFMLAWSAVGFRLGVCQAAHANSAQGGAMEVKTS